MGTSKMKSMTVLSFFLVVASLVLGQETTTATTPSITTTPRPCWMDAINKTKTENHITCEVCTVIFQGLDDYLLDNEDQIAHALENLAKDSPGYSRFAGDSSRFAWTTLSRCWLKTD